MVNHAKYAQVPAKAKDVAITISGLVFARHGILHWRGAASGPGEVDVQTNPDDGPAALTERSIVWLSRVQLLQG